MTDTLDARGPLVNRLKRRLLAGEKEPVLWVELESPTLIEAAVHAGWSTVLIDNEHGWLGHETLLHMLRAAEAAGGQVIVRLPDGEPTTLKRALDLGIQSVMVPMVNSAAEARKLVDAARYPPRGRRGYAAPIVRASRYGAHGDYAAWAHEELLLIVQVEHVDAVAAVEEIAAVEGVDMVFIGPHDLAGSMGLLERLDDPRVEEAVRKVEEATLNAGKLLGSIPRPQRDAEACFEAGHALCACAADIMLFREAAIAARKRF